MAHGCVAGSSSPTFGFLQHLLRSSLACLRSALWLPGTVGEAQLRCGHRWYLLVRLVRSCISSAAVGGA